MVKSWKSTHRIANSINAKNTQYLYIIMNFHNEINSIKVMLVKKSVQFSQAPIRREHWPENEKKKKNICYALYMS